MEIIASLNIFISILWIINQIWKQTWTRFSKVLPNKPLNVSEHALCSVSSRVTIVRYFFRKGSNEHLSTIMLKKMMPSDLSHNVWENNVFAKMFECGRAFELLKMYGFHKTINISPNFFCRQRQKAHTVCSCVRTWCRHQPSWHKGLELFSANIMY